MKHEHVDSTECELHSGFCPPLSHPSAFATPELTHWELLALAELCDQKGTDRRSVALANEWGRLATKVRAIARLNTLDK